MRYHDIKTDDMLNGDGLRVVLWVSGCNHYCRQCQNPITWDPNQGLIFGEEAINEIFEKMDHDYISGLTLSGGDPMYPANRDDILNLVIRVKERFPDKTIWMYTGYKLEQIRHHPILKYVDILVDGPFVPELAEINYHWAGSTNQRVIKLH